MRVIFMGTPMLAAELLEWIHTRVEIVGVVTQPDKPQGRSSLPKPSPVKERAKQLLPQVPLLQPPRIRAPEVYQAIQLLKPDLILVAAYGQILPTTILNVTPYGCINVHYSLLPRLRGAAPIQWTLLGGEHEGGVTLIRMSERMDAGPILAQEKLLLTDGISSGELEQQLSVLSHSMLEKLLQELVDYGQLREIPQDETKATLAPKITLQDARISWSEPIEKIDRLLRAMDPHPGAWCELISPLASQRVQCFSPFLQRPKNNVLPNTIPGCCYGEKGIVWIAGGDGFLGVKELKVEGKKRMHAQAFLAGHDIRNYRFV